MGDKYVDMQDTYVNIRHYNVNAIKLQSDQNYLKSEEKCNIPLNVTFNMLLIYVDMQQSYVGMRT